MFARFFFRAHGLDRQPIGIAVLARSIVTLLAQTARMTGQIRPASSVNEDPHLKAAFRREPLVHLKSHAWKAATIGAAGTVRFFGIVSGFYPVCDSVMTAVGAGAQRATFCFKYRSS
jgi:hypothetical protein